MKGSDYSPLSGTYEATAGALCPVLSPSRQMTNWKETSRGPNKIVRRLDYYIQEEYREAKFVQHGEGKLRKDLLAVLHYLMYCYREDRSRL